MSLPTASREFMLDQRRRRGKHMRAPLSDLKDYYACGSNVALAMFIQDLDAAGEINWPAVNEILTTDPVTRKPEETATDA